VNAKRWKEGRKEVKEEKNNKQPRRKHNLHAQTIQKKNTYYSGFIIEIVKRKEK